MFFSLYFVHGLKDKVSQTWDTQEDQEWFVENISDVCGNVRAYVYEYQRQDLQMDLVETIDQAAEDLLSSWESVQSCSFHNSATPPIEDFTVGRPLFFVCHDIGSLIVEKALLLAKKVNGRPSMSRSTFGIIYLGVPHRRDAQAWAKILKSPKILANGTSSVSKNPHTREPRGFIKIVADTLSSTESNARTSRRRRCKNSPQYFSDIQSSFDSEVWKYTSMHFCRDTDSSCCPGILVHQDCLWSMSSQGRIPRYEQMNYIIPDALPRVIRKAVVAHAIVSMGEAAARDFRERQRWLTDQQTLKDMHSQQRLGRTGNWLLKSDEIQTWKNPKGSGLLWLSGASGTGKSILCSTLLDKLNYYVDIGSTFFCFFDDSLGGFDPAQYVLRTFLYQFDGYRQPLIPNDLIRYAIKSLERLTSPMTTDVFREHLRNVLDQIPSQIQVLLLLDGLDGLDDENWIKQVIVDEIIVINRSMKRLQPIRCIISTRDRYVSPLHLKQITQINLDDEPGVQGDIQRFVATWLTDLPQNPQFGKIPSTSVAQQLCSQANGLFLRAALAIESIFRMHSLENLISKIKAMPTTMQEQYQKMFAAIRPSDSEMARRVFSWLIGARRLLYLSDFHEFMEQKSVTYPSTFGTPSASTVRTEFPSEADISHICGGLVVFAKCGVARFRHQSIREYLLRPNNSRVFKTCSAEAHELIAKTCLQCLSEMTATEDHALISLALPSSQRPRTEPLSPLADYALSNWSFHYRQAETHSRVLAGMLQRYLSKKLYKICDALIIKKSQKVTQISSTILRYSAFCGFATLAKLSLEMGSHPNGDGCDGCKTPLAIAAEKRPNDRQLLKLLICKGATTTSSASADFDATLLIAASQGLLDAVELNLMRGANVQAANRSGETSLHIAADLGDIQMVQLLMRFGADVNAMVSSTAETPLHLAAAHGHLDIVRCLVDKRDASRREMDSFQKIAQEPSYQDWKASLLSADNETEGFVWKAGAKNLAENHMQELLSYSDRYVDINKQTSEGLTPLNLAATNSNEETVRYLISRGAAVQTTTNDQRTALQNAAENGHLDIMRLLMDNGAFFNDRPNTLGPIIESAKAKGHETVASMLSFKSYSTEIMGEPCPWSTIALATKYPSHDMSQIQQIT